MQRICKKLESFSVKDQILSTKWILDLFKLRFDLLEKELQFCPTFDWSMPGPTSFDARHRNYGLLKDSTLQTFLTSKEENT